MKKYYIYIAVAVVIVVAIYFFYKNYKKKQIEKAMQNGEQPKTIAQEVGDYIQETVSMSNGSTEAKDSIPPLKKGSKGKYVKELQNALMNRYKQKLKYGADGIWGKETEQALINAKLPTTIYWKQWSAITGIPIETNGKQVQFIAGKK